MKVDESWVPLGVMLLLAQILIAVAFLQMRKGRQRDVVRVVGLILGVPTLVLWVIIWITMARQ